MGAIKETFILQDAFSNTFAKFIKMAEDSTSSLKANKAAASAVVVEARALSAAYRVAAASRRQHSYVLLQQCIGNRRLRRVKLRQRAEHKQHS